MKTVHEKWQFQIVDFSWFGLAKVDITLHGFINFLASDIIVVSFS